MKTRCILKITTQWLVVALLLAVAPWGAFAGVTEALDDQLIEAAGQGDLDRVRSLLESGMHANAADNSGGTALMRASRAGHPEIAKLLVEKGADINSQSITGWTALMLAAGSDKYEVVALLIEKGAKLDLRATDGDTTALTEAIKNHAVVSARLLLDHDANAVRRGGWHSLHWALWHGDVEMVRLLLDKGLDVNMRTSEGETILMAAISQVRKERWSWQMLIPGPGPRYPSGETDIDVARLLLERGADVNAKAKNGDTALKLAQKRGSKEIVELLKAHGAKE